MWTDYPIKGLGDEPWKEAPIREVERVQEYDPPHEKYLKVTVQGVTFEMKRCYLYDTPRRAN